MRGWVDWWVGGKLVLINYLYVYGRDSWYIRWAYVGQAKTFDLCWEWIYTNLLGPLEGPSTGPPTALRRTFFQGNREIHRSVAMLAQVIA